MKEIHDPNAEKIWISNLPKLLIAALTIVCVTVLLGIHAVSTEAGLPIISMCALYCITNGIRGGTGSKPTQE